MCVFNLSKQFLDHLLGILRPCLITYESCLCFAAYTWYALHYAYAVVANCKNTRKRAQNREHSHTHTHIYWCRLTKYFSNRMLSRFLV